MYLCFKLSSKLGLLILESGLNGLNGRTRHARAQNPLIICYLPQFLADDIILNMAGSDLITKEKLNQAVNRALEYFDFRLSLEREKIMGYYNTERLWGITESSNNPKWIDEIQKLKPPKLRYFEVAHNLPRLRKSFSGCITYEGGSDMRRRDVVNFIVSAVEEIPRVSNYQKGDDSDKSVIDEVTLEALSLFAQQLNLTQEVAVKLSRMGSIHR